MFEVQEIASGGAASAFLSSSPEKSASAPSSLPFQERGHLVAVRPREQNLHSTELISQKPDSHIGTDAEWQSRKVSALAREGERGREGEFHNLARCEALHLLQEWIEF